MKKRRRLRKNSKNVQGGNNGNINDEDFLNPSQFIKIIVTDK